MQENNGPKVPMAHFLCREYVQGRYKFIYRTKRGTNARQREALGYLTDKQHTEIVYGGAAGGAKSWTGCTWLAFACLGYPGSKWFIGREEIKRLRDSSLITFFNVCRTYGIQKDVHYRYMSADNYIQFTNGSRIDLLDLKYLPGDPLYERYGSVEYTGGWIEEAGEIDFGAYDTLKTRIGRHRNDEHGLLRKLFITCNPKKNWLYTNFYKPQREGKLEERAVFIKALVRDNPNMDQGYVEGLQSISSAQRKERLLHGNWEYDDDPSRLMDTDAIADLFTNSFVEEGKFRCITADIALQGSDKFVLGVWYGLQLKDMCVLRGKDAKEVEHTIKNFASRHNVPRSNILYDADGVGSFLRSYLEGAKPFVNGSKALNGENFRNLKTQCYYKLAEYVNHHLIKICPDDWQALITEELEQIKATPVEDGKLAMISKDDIKANIGRSPDFADMMAMRMYFELKKRGRGYFGFFRPTGIETMQVE